MHLIYIDDSRDEQLCVFSALAVPSDEWRNAFAAVRQLRRDVLACDDAAWAVLRPPRRLTALLVTRGNPVLLAALRSCPLAQLDVKTPAQFDAMDHPALAVQQPYDVIVLDDHAPGKLPRGRYIVFGRPPPDIGVSAPATVAVPGRIRPSSATAPATSSAVIPIVPSTLMTPSHLD